MTAYTSLPAFLTDMADAIRSKTGGTSPIAAGDMPTAIAGISSVNIAEITATPSSIWEISFTGLAAKPKMFCVVPTNNKKISSSAKYCSCLCALGETGTFATSSNLSNSAAWIHYSTTNFSWAYKNGTLTVEGDNTVGRFETTSNYRLVYVY